MGAATTVTLYETFRAVFYTPFYLPFTLGNYAAEGLDVQLGAPRKLGGAAPALLAGEVDVIWSGPLKLIEHHDRDPGCPLVAFCEVVTRDPFFLVAREPNPGFRFHDLLDRTVGIVSEVPTPWLCLQDDIRRAGIDPDAVRRISDRTMPENAAALRAGDVDVVQLFQPMVESLVAEGAGHIWYAAATRGPTSYTTLITTRETTSRTPDVVMAMTRAIYRSQKWLHTKTPTEIGESVAEFFPGLSRELLVGAIERYLDLGIWGRNPRLPCVGFVRQKLAMLSGGYITRDVPYESCVDNGFADAVIAEDPAV